MINGGAIAWSPIVIDNFSVTYHCSHLYSHGCNYRIVTRSQTVLSRSFCLEYLPFQFSFSTISLVLFIYAFIRETRCGCPKRNAPTFVKLDDIFHFQQRWLRAIMLRRDELKMDVTEDVIVALCNDFSFNARSRKYVVLSPQKIEPVAIS